MKQNNILLSLLTLTLVACGGGGGGGGSSIQAQMEPLTDGTYYTVLRPVNFASNGYIPYGSATFKVSGDQFSAATTMDDDQRVIHRQSVHLGTRCPSQSDDRNGDGFVDYQEAMAVVGPVMIPLDNDISSQAAGAGSYPRGGGMTYNRSASLSRISADLWQLDENGADEITKLASGEPMGLNSRVVLIHGTLNSALPATVAARAGETPDQSLPVVCGVLKKVN